MSVEQSEFEKMVNLSMRVANRMSSLEKKPRDFGTGDLLTRAEIHTVQAIGDNPTLSITGLAKHLNVTKGAVSQMVDRLEEKSLVSRYKTPNNARDVRLELTARGKVARLSHEAMHAHFRDLTREHFGKEFDKRVRAFSEVFEEMDTILTKLESSLY